MNVRDFIYAEIRKIVINDNITDNLKLRDDLSIDSLDIANLLMDIETQYNLPVIESDFLITNGTVGDLIAVVEAMDPEPNISTAQTPESSKQTPTLKKPLLYKLRNDQPWCMITEKPCAKIQQKLHQQNPCAESKCKIARNVFNLINTLQKTK